MATNNAWISPLVEIERQVQTLAKAAGLDMTQESGPARMRALIESQVTVWSDEHKRGLRKFDITDPALLAERAFRNLAGYGPLEPLLEDDDVWEICVNAPD